MRDDLRTVYYIIRKAMKAYYLKPPAISWGILFPVVMSLSFYLRNPTAFGDLVPGLLALTVLFSTTAMEAVVINFELRVGSLERLLLAPASLTSVVLGKVLGASLFGLIIMARVALAALPALPAPMSHPAGLVITATVSSITFAGLGALVSVAVREVFEAQTLGNFLRFPMMFLCGVFIPVSSLPAGLRHLAYALPLTYTVDGFRHALAGAGAMPLSVDALALCGFALPFPLLAARFLRRRFI